MQIMFNVATGASLLIGRYIDCHSPTAAFLILFPAMVAALALMPVVTGSFTLTATSPWSST
ncbi:hypothetical protein SAMN05518849_12311 [Sphingobium sp. AP50]|uniref:hypothetical protein n=1 Tax=Sphingobium sp. AP50 TaxID=1884369 RepID=UPI0008BE351E|nr:hypothetical protein [Sphingobium sp. AP50]SEJ98485.1 hypothetical protein SAMN05518849_12311 [Sphingobium sp. AP50]